MRETDNSIALQKYAIDCISCGRLLDAKSAIKESISKVKVIDAQAVDDELVRLVGGMK